MMYKYHKKIDKIINYKFRCTFFMSNAFCYVLVSDEVVHARVDNKVVLCFLVTMSRLRCGR